jgi:hypothetical protein
MNAAAELVSLRQRRSPDQKEMSTMKQISLLGRTGLAVVLVATAVVTVWAAAKSSILPTNKSRPEKTIEQAVNVMKGTWKLEKRINSDGTTHAKVDGITTIDLAIVNSKLLGERALGSAQAREHGDKLDRRFGSCVPPEAADKPFLTESAGTWDMTVASEDADTAILTVRQNHVVVKADFQPYQDGMSTDVEATYRLYKAKPGQPSRLELATPLKFKNNFSLKGEATVAVGSLDESCCDVSTMQVSGDNMKINWSNGGQDFWVRVSPVVSEDAYSR